MLIRLPVPPSTNNLFANAKSGGRFITGTYKSWLKEAATLLMIARPERFGTMKVQVGLYVPRKPVSRDIDNFCKAPIDLLVKHGVLADDKQIEKLTVERHDSPDLLVSVEPYGEPATDARVKAAGYQ